MTSYLRQTGSFSQFFSLPLYHHCTQGAEAEAGNTCNAWWLPEVRRTGGAGATQRPPEQPNREFDQNCHFEINRCPCFLLQGSPRKAGAKPSPAGTLPSPDLAQQDCTNAAVSRAACGCRGHLAVIQLSGFLFSPLWVVGAGGESHCIAGSQRSTDGANWFSAGCVTWLRLRCLHCIWPHSVRLFPSFGSFFVTFAWRRL